MLSCEWSVSFHAAFTSLVLLPSSLLLYQQLLPLTKSSIVLGALRCHLLTELLLLLCCHVQNAQLLLTIFLG